MNPSNKQLTSIAIGGVVLYAFTLLAFILGYTGILAILVLNAVASFLVLSYWISKQLRIIKHYFEFRELAVLGLELLALILSVYAILHQPLTGWIEIVSYVCFGLHFLAALLFLIFCLTFKIKKLF